MLPYVPRGEQLPSSSANKGPKLGAEIYGTSQNQAIYSLQKGIGFPPYLYRAVIPFSVNGAA